MSAILPYRNCFYKWTKYNSKQSHDTTAILISLWCALRLDQLFSTIYEKLNIWHFYEVSVVRLWWTSENHVSRYLFLEQIAHFLEGVLTFLRKAGDLIQRFSESTHIDVLNKACKMMKVRKKLNSFSSSDQWPEVPPPHRCGSNVTNYAPSPAQLSSRSRRQTPTRESRETKFKLCSVLNPCEHNAVDEWTRHILMW